MQIAMWVPYDEKRLRRTIQFLARPQLKTIRLLGAILAVLGLGLIALDPSLIFAYAVGLIGILFVFAIGPMTVARAVRQQSNVIKDGFHMTLDDEWLTVRYPLAESRFRWVGLDRAVEAPDAWYIMFGKLQALTIPKYAMTDEQRAEFTAFVRTVQSGL